MKILRHQPGTHTVVWEAENVEAAKQICNDNGIDPDSWPAEVDNKTAEAIIQAYHDSEASK